MDKSKAYDLALIYAQEKYRLFLAAKQAINHLDTPYLDELFNFFDTAYNFYLENEKDKN